MNSKVILAVFRRDFSSYFSNPTGYVFITIFIFMSASAAFWSPRFFLDNLANLDHLNTLMPYLLLFFVPAITMGIWAGERSRGTDELLLTLPARDTEVVLGKYLAALGIYTVSLGFSLSHVFVLLYLGSPDLGIMLGTYLGYWLMGATLLALGLVASYLTTNATVAFIYGAGLSATLVFSDRFGRFFFDGRMRDFFEWISIPSRFEPFGDGRFLVSSVVYAGALIATFLFLNVVLVGRRHWTVKEQGMMWIHQWIRGLATVVTALAIAGLFHQLGLGGDLTSERLHTLSPQALKVLSDLDSDRPVQIEAYISAEVPRGYVETRESLVSTLREFDRIAGRAIRLAIYDTEQYTEEARRARDNFGIVPFSVQDDNGGVTEIFLGVAFTCGAEDDSIVLDRGLSVEYELTRSVRVVSRTERKTIGILRTDAKLNGGFDMQTFQRLPQWSIVSELKRQYKVVDVAADQPISTDIEKGIDALVVALPSSLSEPQQKVLRDWVLKGGPTIMLCDPAVVQNMGLSASLPRSKGGNPFQQQRGPQPPPKGKIEPLLKSLGVRWAKDRIVWQEFNPHKEFSNLNREVVFLSPEAGSGRQLSSDGQASDAWVGFNPEHPSTSGLQELVMLFGGGFDVEAGSKLTHTPLLRTSRISGANVFGTIAGRDFFGNYSPKPKESIPYHTDAERYTVALQVEGPLPELKDDKKKGDKEGDKDDDKKAGDKKDGKTWEGLNTVLVADLDMIGEQFFQIRRSGVRNLRFDNVTFVLNCVDMLCGDESFVRLRKKRPTYRTLETIETINQEFTEEVLAKEAEAEKIAEDALKEARKRLDDEVAKIQKDASLDWRNKQLKVKWIQNVEQRRLQRVEAEAEREKQSTIEAARAEKERRIRSIQRRIRIGAVALPPLPAFFLALVVLWIRRRRENLGAVESRIRR